MRKQMKQLENDKNDFDSYQDMARCKFMDRESELKQQLEAAYKEMSVEGTGQLSGLPTGGSTEHTATIKQLQAKIEELQDEVRFNLSAFIYSILYVVFIKTPAIFSGELLFLIKTVRDSDSERKYHG